MYKVFYNDRFLILSEKTPCHSLPCITHRYTGRKELCRSVHDFFHSTVPCMFIPCESPGKMFEEVCKCFIHIVAGGGLVTDPAGRYLLIRRRGVWDLPKGKAARGESPEEAALREVKEECGLDRLIPGKKILTTYHTYLDEGVPCLKSTHWFRMHSPQVAAGKPQVEEQITELRWFTRDELPGVAELTYASIRDVLEASALSRD